MKIFKIFDLSDVYAQVWPADGDALGGYDAGVESKLAALAHAADPPVGVEPANLSNAAIGSDPGERTNIRGAVAIESL